MKLKWRMEILFFPLALSLSRSFENPTNIYFTRKRNENQTADINSGKSNDIVVALHL